MVGDPPPPDLHEEDEITPERHTLHRSMQPIVIQRIEARENPGHQGALVVDQ